MSPEVIVYWRPGCPFCPRLLRQLDRLGVQHRRLNIWSDPGAAATVRRVAGGNETVPTVLVGNIALVNPAAKEVLRVARELVPSAVMPPTSRRRVGLIGRLRRRQPDA